jgi:hypothetical protein
MLSSKLALTLPTSGSHFVGIVRWWTEAPEFFYHHLVSSTFIFFHSLTMQQKSEINCILRVAIQYVLQYHATGMLLKALNMYYMGSDTLL